MWWTTRNHDLGKTGVCFTARTEPNAQAIISSLFSRGAMLNAEWCHRLPVFEYPLILLMDRTLGINE